MVYPPQAVILAGGLATRLRPITETVPKSLVEVGSRPFLEYQLVWLRRQGIHDVLLLVGYLGEQIVARFGDGGDLGLRIGYRADGPALRGTGGAILAALPDLNDEFLVLNGDTFIDLNLSDFWRAFELARTSAALAVGRPESSGARPNVATLEGRVTRYEATNESGACNRAHVGVCGFTVRDLAVMQPVSNMDLGELIRPLLDQRRVLAWPVDESFYDMGTPDGLRRFEEIAADILTDRVIEQEPQVRQSFSGK